MMKQSTFSAVMANKLLTVLQGYSKTIRLLLVMFLTLTVSANAWAEEETLACPAGTISNNQMTWDLTSCTIVHAKGTNNNYVANSPWRVYQGAIVTFTPKSNTSISEIVITATSSSYATAGANTWTNATANASGSTITVIPTDGTQDISITASAQTRWSNIDITYTTAGGGDPVDPEVTFSNGEYTIGGAALDLSTLWESNSSGAVTYSVTNAGTTGATVNGTSFTATAAGTCTVQASQAATATHNAATATATITVTAPAGGGGGEETWTLVTNASNLKDGDQIVIAAKDYNFALSTTQNNNNRGQAAVTKNGETITFGNDVQVLTLQTGNVSNLFAFYTGGGYLYAASSTKNYLRTETNLSNNSSWSIVITNEGVATITAQGTNTNNLLRYNLTSSIFSCYGSGQADVSIYKKAGGTTTYTITSTLSHVTADGSNPTTITSEAEDLTLSYSAESGWNLPATISVTMGGTPLSSETDYDWDNGDLLIAPASGFTGNIVVTINGWQQLAAPTGLNVSNITSSGATLAWNAVTHATSYTVQVYGETDEIIAEYTDLTQTTKEVSGLESDTYYIWAVTAIGDGTTYTDSEESETAEFTTLNPCEKLGAATNLTVETDFVQDGQTYVKFSWTPADNTKTNATSQKICFGKVDEAGTCVDNLAKNQTWTGDLASKLSAGEYWWSIQALGDGTNYCDGDVVNGTNFYIYSITYNTNGGTTIPATSGTTLPDPLPTTTKTGYTFAGWYTDSEFNTSATAGAPITQNTILYAKWTINQYTVTLNPNYPDGKTGTFKDKVGNTVNGNLVFTYDYNTTSKEIESLYTSLSLDGYEFGGWYNAKGVNPGEVSGSKCTTTGTITGNKTYFAKWTKLYSITLSENGTTTTPTTQTSTSYTLPTELSVGTCENDEKELVGWSTVAIPNPGDKPTSNFYELGETVTLTADQTTFYAVFATGTTTDEIITTEETATLSFENVAQRTSFSTTQQVWEQNGIVFTNNKAESSNDIADYINPVRCYKKSEIIIDCNALGNITKVQFRCSSSDFAGDLEISIGKEATSDGTWVTLIPKSKSKIYEITLAEGQTRIYTLTVTYEKISDNASSVSYSDYTTSCDNTKATITYDLNGGTGADCEKQVVTKGEEFTLCSQTPTKEGYTFAGWSDGTTIYAAGAQVTVSESTTFYATWTAKTITITWNQNYTDCPESETSTYIYDGEDIDMPEDPTREGYKFDGWYTADGTEITEVGETNKPTSDVTYYAHWAELYTVTFMASGQVYVVQEHKYLSGETLELPADPSAANYACDGYIFEGWSAYEKTKEDATLPELVSTSTTIDADKEFYALWKKASSEGAGETIFYESFNNSGGTGGNDDKWSGDIATSEAYVDNNGWEGENVYGANKCIKLGSGKAKGYITTPTLSSLSGKATLTFKAAAWDGSNEQTDLILSITGGGTLDKTSVTITKGAWQDYEVTIYNGTSATQITFAGKNASDSRFFLDEVNITTSGSYNYTTLPNCGPTIVAKDGMWVTSADGQSVKVNVPIAVKSFTTTATITGTSANENFEVTRLENVGNDINNVLEVIYTPTTANSKESATITLTAKDGEIVVSTTTFTLNGRSLPDQFAIVVDKASEYYALPANMPAEDTYLGFGVEVNDGTVTAAPKTHLYTMRAVHSTRFAENGTAIRLVGNNNACLWASSAAKSTDIRNWAKTDNAKATNYEWSLYTEDGDTYRISSTAVTEEGRVLRYNGEKFGMYKEGTDVLRLLPVGCSSTPLNVQVSPARVSAIVSWTNAGACELVVKQGGVTVVTLPSATSPAQVSNLAESTAYTFTLIPNDDASCGVSGAFTTTGPSIDIVEWQMEGIRIQVDKDEDVNPIIIINGEEEHGDVGGQVATELFFSKYFEAHGENKLLAVYNGTTQTIDLNGYVIKHGSVEIDLSQYGQTKGSIASNEEIIFVSFDNDATKSAEPCAEKEEGFSSWNVLETTKLAFSGRGSVGLYKDDVLIDLIGSIYPSGELTKIGKAGKPDYCGTGDDVQLHVDGVSVNDQSSFFCHNGDNIKTPEVETDYPISTNRCLLIRKNSVTSGADAVASNKAEDGAKCGDLSSTFATLCSEWGGFRIGSGKSSDDEIQDATCEGLGYVGGFDYNNYYRTMETIYEGTELDDYEKNPDDNTYFIGIEDLAQYSCLNIQLQLTDNDGNVLADQISQVPILVDGKKTTTDELFSAIVNDGETPDYENSKIRCATCDVVILNDATLTKAAPETPNDVNQVRDIYVYPGGKLIIPEGATDYSVNSVSLRRNQDDVSMADIQTPLNITSSSKTPVYVDVRINSKNWHWLSLPYNCNIADVTWKNGSKALYNSDWFLMYYDGESRVNEQSHYENHWKLFEGTTIEAGKGYIVGITGHATKSGVQYELRFPMAAEVLTHEKKDKTVAVNAWGVNMDVTPNKKGWNLVGNPYLDYYQPSTGGFAGLPLIKYTNMDPVTGEWHYDNSGDVPFIVTPVDGGWYEYRQDLASEVDMKPFTSYFVQVGQPDSHEDDEKLSASFTHSQRGRSSLIRRAPQEVNEVEEPIIVGVELTNSKGESDKTTLIIDDRFTSDYEMNADFFKWFGDYYKYYTKPVLYSVGADAGKRAFNALSEQLAAQPVALGMFAAQAGDYTFSLTRKRCDLSRVEEVWLYDATTATYTNLMQQDYTFTTAKTEGEGRFYLSVKMKQKTPTAVENVNGNLSLVAHQQTLMLSGLPAEAQVWVYDATGKLLHSEHTTAYQRIYPVQQAGVYFVSVKGQGDAQTLSTIVK